MKRLILIVGVICSISKVSAQGWGDWERQTPFGNQMSDPGNGANFFMAKTSQELTGISRWYFFKGCTIGQYQQGYFIANERASTITTYQSKQEWEKEVDKQQLKPYWTRWYQDDWHFLDDMLLMMILAFYITIPLIIVFIVILFKAIRTEHLNPRKPCTLILIGITVFVIFQYYLEINPISI